MTKFLTGVIAAGVLLAASSGVSTAVEYPPCKSRSDDRCIQVPAAQMKKEMQKEMTREMMKEEAMPVPADIPRGCSPATTPCE